MPSESHPPFISVVVPVYNVRRFVGVCVHALLQQDYPPDRYEVLLVDNNSSDGSLEGLAADPRLRLLSERKQGAYAARNRALSLARGEIIAFTDSDCVPEPNWLREIIGGLTGPTRIVLGSHMNSGSSSTLAQLTEYDNEKKSYICNSDDPHLYYGSTNNMAVRRDLIDEIGPFEELRRGADTIFVWQCVRRHGCESVRYLATMRVQHLEIDTVAKLLCKYFLYGRSRRMYHAQAPVRRLTNGERLRIYRRGARTFGVWAYSPPVAVALAAGAVCWQIGALSALVSRRRL